IPAHRKHVDEHLNAVAQHAHFGGRRMPPTHGYFHRAQSMAPRQVQQLRVKSKALNRLLLEDHAAALAPEGFETTLRIDKWQPQDGSHTFVENDSRKFAKARLVPSDHSAAHHPSTNPSVPVLKLASA